jgi:hypothetical protein
MGRFAMGFMFILIYSTVILLVVEIAAALLVITGLERDIARFQALSMLTSTGFTTKESELVLQHPVRRKIAAFLIIFGVFSLAVMISTMSNILSQSFRIPILLMVTGILILMLVVVKNKHVMDALTRKLHKHLKKEYELHELPIHEVLYIHEDEDLFTEIYMFAESSFINKKMTEIIQHDEDIHLLLIKRGLEKFRHRFLELTVHEGDILYVYGSKAEIEKKFNHEMEKMKSDIRVGGEE